MAGIPLRWKIPRVARSGRSTRLGGLTNLVFQVGAYCLRIPGKGTEEYINRANEEVAAREAAKAGVSPEVLHFDRRRRDGHALHRRRAETMSPAAVQANRGAGAGRRGLPQAARSGAKFDFRFELFAMIDDYLKILSTKDVALPAGYHDVVREADGRSARPSPRTRCRSSPATATRCARTSSTPASACGSSTGNIPA